MAARAPRIAVVGFPNVGKSTLVNRLTQTRAAVVHELPGATRDRKEIETEWNSQRLVLIDTGGIDFAGVGTLGGEVRKQAEIAIGEADLVMLVVDAQVGVTLGDQELAELLRKARKATVVVANKIDTAQQVGLAAEFHRLGLGEPQGVSAAHGLGTGELLDVLVEALQSFVPAGADEPGVRVAVIGRPNVGKSTLVNALLRQERLVVHDAPGTTRDAIDTRLRFRGRSVTLVDTAGLRRRAKVAGSVDYYAQLRSEQAVERADVAILVCDACDGITAEDLRIGELAMSASCATLVALNKWDLSQPDLEELRGRIAKKLRLQPEVVTSSATGGRNIIKIMERALALYDRAGERLATAVLNRFLSDLQAEHQPPALRGRRLRIYYGAQIQTRPPRFVIQINDRHCLSRSYAYFVENRLRADFGLEGVPLRIDFQGKSR